MTRSVPDRYFFWLYDQVCIVRSVESVSSYVRVCRHMHNIKFKSLVEFDENRASKGGDLRNEFKRLHTLEPFAEVDFLYPDATIFETLVALTKDANFMADRGEKLWFHEFVTNLGLDRCYDHRMLHRSESPIERALHKFNDRKYKPNGAGGLFPLKFPSHDQREVELWYQMGSYVTENHLY